MKLFTFLLLLIITLIKYIESCLSRYFRLTDCSWSGGDPCNQYNADECSEHEGCIWDHIEGPNDRLGVGVEVKSGETKVSLNTVDDGRPIDIIACKGKNYKPCYFSCSIF